MFSYVTRIWTEIKMIHNYKKTTDEYKRPAENMWRDYNIRLNNEVEWQTSSHKKG